MPAASKFKIGDIVTLKSGGPRMTVTSFEQSSGKVSCTWFGQHDTKPVTDFFQQETLDRAVEGIPTQPS